MVSKGMALTGPVGPDGKGGSSCFFALDLVSLRCGVCAAFAGHRFPAHRTARLSTKTTPARLNSNPVLINCSSGCNLRWENGRRPLEILAPEHAQVRSSKDADVTRTPGSDALADFDVRSSAAGCKSIP